LVWHQFAKIINGTRRIGGCGDFNCKMDEQVISEHSPPAFLGADGLDGYL
jgi:hypothetical protein